METQDYTYTPYLTTVEAANLIRHQPQTLRRWRVNGSGPPYLRLSGRVLYDPEELKRWVASHRRTSTADGNDCGQL